MPARENPAPLVVAASLAAIEGGLLATLGGLEALHLTTGRLTMGVTTAVFFLVTGLGVMTCAYALTRGQAWARGPVVITQLLGLGVAWSFRSGGTTLLALGLAVTALIVLAGIFHPSSTEQLADRPEG